MNFDIDKLQKKLCELMCAEVTIKPRNEKLLVVETPFYFADGDIYQIYIREMSGGILRLTDMGHTMIHLSYENDIDKFKKGTRGNILNQIKAETSVEEDNGEFFIDTPLEHIAFNIFRLGQALTKIVDVTFLNRARAESTFYEDLREQLLKIVPEDKITEEYFCTEIEQAKDYPIDYKIDGKDAPLFLFGIPGKDKAQLTTIVIERLLRGKVNFDSLLIFADQTLIPRNALARLSNVGGEMVSLDAFDDLSRKIYRKIPSNESNSGSSSFGNTN
ncbi:DUF1828 domain-containing protein [Candidatus Magnetomonas plexicatena]|uniref:DUF1828 domain-containing protein n=1 Tax=Candidatus Magnetomonas plexicatena TaxID=2552947 RepID=UPI001C74DFAE|nr:DUF1828 domain-containing protein [Nitrospirales bacterium LBB_01]